jgi:ATP adenylyltransferase/5',5'''-P-1,P-4-tetraphosphate phosphorylase II
LPASRIFAHCDSSQNLPSLGQLATDLLEQQKTAWPQLAEGCRAFETVRVRELHGDGCSVRLQFNPRRIVSSGAKVDAQSIQARPCFLCLDNLPVQQKGISYGDEFLVLCNPAPIFAQHFTISHVRHQPQAIAGHVEILLKLARDFSPQLSVFYNGPRCGASAPDHMHFQACPAQTIPLETQIDELAQRLPAKKLPGVSVHMIESLKRKILLLTGADQSAMAPTLLRTFEVMKEAMRSDEEPMMNIVCSFREDLYRVLIFPRCKHRPEVYFREGEDRILISPAAVDIGGLIITPVEKDFLQVDAQTIESIYREVSITPETLRQIIDLL